VKWQPNVPPPEPVQMPDMPSYVQQLPQMLKEHILEISGQGETSQGRVPAGARSGVAIAYLQEEDDTKLGPTVSEYEEMIERTAWLTLRVMAERYDIPRTIDIFKRNSEPEVIDFYGAMLEGVGRVETQAGSALPRSKAAKQQFMFDLWDRGIVQDPRQLMEMLELTQAEASDWEQDMAQARRENSKLEQGQQQNVLDWYNHEMHQSVHRNYMKSADFDGLPENVKQVWYDHDEMHTKAMEQAQLKQAALGMVTGGQAPPGGGPAPPLASSNGQNQPVPQQGGQPGSPPPPMTNDVPQ
jgi:hypothetical protein